MVQVISLPFDLDWVTLENHLTATCKLTGNADEVVVVTHYQPFHRDYVEAVAWAKALDALTSEPTMAEEITHAVCKLIDQVAQVWVVEVTVTSPDHGTVSTRKVSVNP